jgi:hypothetical protein
VDPGQRSSDSECEIATFGNRNAACKKVDALYEASQRGAELSASTLDHKDVADVTLTDVTLTELTSSAFNNLVLYYIPVGTSVDLERSLAENGCDEIIAIARLAARLQRHRTRTPASISVLHRHSIAALAGLFVAKATSSHFQSLVTKSCRAMAEIDSQIPPDLLAPPPPPAPLHSKNGLFLTGASGFLGVHVLSHVLQPTTSAPVFCFLRGGCKDHALSRRQHSAAAANVELSWHRVTVIVGDISLPLFGLNAD